MGREDVDHAGPEEYRLVGIVGLVLNCLILVSSILGYKHAKPPIPRYFFLSLFAMALLEIPRYVQFIVARDYRNTVCYGFHILAGYAFFLCLTLVCLMWGGLLELGTYSTVLYSKRGLMLANALFFIIVIVATVVCFDSRHLFNYFESKYYTFYTLTEMVINFVYSVLIAYYGVRLIFRFQNYLKAGNNKSDPQAVAFDQAMRKVAFAFIMNCIFSLVRVSLLLVKLTAVDIESRRFPKYGLLWFLWSDFIPRYGAALVLIDLVITRSRRITPSNEQRITKPVEDDPERDSHIRIEECRPSGDTDDFSLGIRNPVTTTHETRDSMSAYPPGFGEQLNNHMDEEEE